MPAAAPAPQTEIGSRDFTHPIPLIWEVLWEVHMTAHHQTLIASEYPYQRSDVLPIMINRALGAPRGQSQRGWEPRSSKSRHVKSLQVTLRHITSSPSQVTSSPSPVQSSPSQDLAFRILAVHRWQGAVVSASATAPPLDHLARLSQAWFRALQSCRATLAPATRTHPPCWTVSPPPER